MINEQVLDTRNAWLEVLAARVKRKQASRLLFADNVGVANGLDVSSVQTTSQAEWNAIAATGIQFMIAKCGNGNDGTDPAYANNISWAQAAGIQNTACYHFIYPLQTDPAHPGRDPISQAQAHFNASQGQRACIDCEWPAPQDWATWNVTGPFINQWILSYLQEYENLSGQTPIVYSYPDWVTSVGFTADFAQYSYWAASYEPTPTIPAPFTSYVIWQTSGGTVAHLPNGEPVDADVCPNLDLVWPSVAPVTVPTPVPVLNPVPPVQTPIDPISVPANPISNPTSNIWTSIGNTISSIFGRKQ